MVYRNVTYLFVYFFFNPINIYAYAVCLALVCTYLEFKEIQKKYLTDVRKSFYELENVRIVYFVWL